MRELPKLNKQLYVMGGYRPPLDGRREYSGVLADFNELVGSPSKAVLDAIQTATKNPQIYPDYDGLLEKRIAFYAGVSINNVMVTNGSDQAIQIIGRSALNPDMQAIVPQPTFAMLRLVAQETGAEIVEPFYDTEKKAFPTQEVIKSVANNTRLITICSPNNPTGTVTSLADISAIAEAAPQAIVLVDEAYYDFSKVTAAGLIAQYPNIVVTRTFSKAFGIPALRMGYMIGSEDLVAQVAKLRGPYDINQIGYEAAKAALSDEGITETASYIDEVNTKSRPELVKYLESEGIPYWPSGANFILLQALRTNGTKGAKSLADVMANKGFRVREQCNKLPNDPEMIRVSLGDLQTTRKLIETMRLVR